MTSQEDKALVAARKQEVHDRFKAELGLKVDEPKQGAGNTNDDNTAQRAFQDEKTFADICGLNESLVHRFHIILIAISCKFHWILRNLVYFVGKLQNLPLVQNACKCPHSVDTWSSDLVFLNAFSWNDEGRGARSQK